MFERDTIENPGIDRCGRRRNAMWNYGWTGTEGKSCATLPRAMLPKAMQGDWSAFPEVGWRIGKADQCRAANQQIAARQMVQEAAFPSTRTAARAWTTYIKHQSWACRWSLTFPKGRDAVVVGKGQGSLLHPVQGQLNLACRSLPLKCDGKMTSAARPLCSQGQRQRVPTYRLQSGLTSLHSAFSGLHSRYRAEQPKSSRMS